MAGKQLRSLKFIPVYMPQERAEQLMQQGSYVIDSPGAGRGLHVDKYERVMGDQVPVGLLPKIMPALEVCKVKADLCVCTQDMLRLLQGHSSLRSCMINCMWRTWREGLAPGPAGWLPGKPGGAGAVRPDG